MSLRCRQPFFVNDYDDCPIQTSCLPDWSKYIAGLFCSQVYLPTPWLFSCIVRLIHRAHHVIQEGRQACALVAPKAYKRETIVVLYAVPNPFLLNKICLNQSIQKCLLERGFINFPILTLATVVLSFQCGMCPCSQGIEPESLYS